MLQNNNQPTTGANPLNQHFELITEDIVQQEINTDDLLMIDSAGDSLFKASKSSVPKMLFDKFWYEGELCILFADSNLGKSILSMQIANSISKNEAITPFELEAEAQT